MGREGHKPNKGAHPKMSKLEHDWIVRRNFGISSEKSLGPPWKSMVGQVPLVAIGISLNVNVGL
jgi:hypothetical protein